MAHRRPLGECWDVNDQACFDRERRRRKRQGLLGGRATSIKTLAKAVAKNAEAYQAGRACAIDGLKKWRSEVGETLGRRARALNEAIGAALDACEPDDDAGDECSELRALVEELGVDDTLEDLPRDGELKDLAHDWIRDKQEPYRDLIAAIGEPLVEPRCRRKS